MIFHLSNGLRGCYMPDDSCVVSLKTRRDLKEYVEIAAAPYRDAGAVGLSKRAVAAFAAEAWRMARRGRLNGLPLCLPIKPRGACSHSSGIFASRATRRDLAEFNREQPF